MSTASVVKEPKKRSLWLNAWVRLKRNKRAMFGLYFFFFLVIIALMAPLLFPEGYDVQIIDDQYLAPSWEHPFGTDNVGRDILARICYGAKISLQLGLISVAISFVVGGIIGAVVSIKEDTVTIETGKDRCKIRIHRSAVRSIDVKANEEYEETK